MTAKDRTSQRRRPRQARSRATWEAIVEAAAQILERSGADGFNTNAVAERAGVSVGTLYQYFADKQALLIAAARREFGPGASGRRRALIEALITTLERLGGFGGAAAGTNPKTSVQTSKSPRGRVERQAIDLVQDWLGALVPTPRPALIPIPIQRRERPR